MLDDVGLTYDGVAVLDQVSWSVGAGERWVVLGRNGSGKTSLVRIASLTAHPSRGSVRVLGELLGRTDVRTLRRRIGLASPALAAQLRPGLTGTEVVMMARTAALEPWWHTYSTEDRSRAAAELHRFGVGHLAERPIATASSGELQRVLLARATVTDPGLVLLDEPTAGLDLPGREDLVRSLSDLARDRAHPPLVLVTHHLEEVPPGFTHALLLRDGRILAAGALDEVVSSESVSECFGLAIDVGRRGDRWWAAARM